MRDRCEKTGADLDALFTLQPGNRRVPDLP